MDFVGSCILQFSNHNEIRNLYNFPVHIHGGKFSWLVEILLFHWDVISVACKDFAVSLGCNFLDMIMWK